MDIKVDATDALSGRYKAQAVEYVKNATNTFLHDNLPGERPIFSADGR